MSDITYLDKDKNASDGIRNEFRDVDANEIKTVVNGKQDKHVNLTAISSLAGSSGYVKKIGAGLFVLDANPSGEFGETTGTDAYLLTLSDSIVTYAGLRFFAKFSNGNTGPSTLNVNAIGIKSIRKNGSLELESGDIQAGQVYQLLYDGVHLQVVGQVTVVQPPNDPDNFDPWDIAEAPYVAGDARRHVNELWVSDNDGNMTEPGQPGATWTLQSPSDQINLDAVFGAGSGMWDPLGDADLVTWNFLLSYRGFAKMSTNRTAVQLQMLNMRKGIEVALFVRKQNAADLVLTLTHTGHTFKDVEGNTITMITLSGAANKEFLIKFYNAGPTSSANNPKGIFVDVVGEDLGSESTSTEIKFDIERTSYGTDSAPLTATTLTDSNTGAKAGVIQKIYHQAASFTPPATWQKLSSSADYAAGVLNIVYVEYVSSTRKEYVIVQDA